MNTFTTGNQDNARIDRHDNGQFIVTYQDNNSGNIYYRWFYTDGSPVDIDYPINEDIPIAKYNPRVACIQDGDFVVVYQMTGYEGSVQPEIFQQKITNNTHYGAFIKVSTKTSAINIEPEIMAFRNDYSYLIAWSSSEIDG